MRKQGPNLPSQPGRDCSIHPFVVLVGPVPKLIFPLPLGRSRQQYSGATARVVMGPILSHIWSLSELQGPHDPCVSMGLSSVPRNTWCGFLTFLACDPEQTGGPGTPPLAPSVTGTGASWGGRGRAAGTGLAPGPTPRGGRAIRRAPLGFGGLGFPVGNEASPPRAGGAAGGPAGAT